MRPDIIRPTGVNPVGKIEKGRAVSAPFLFWRNFGLEKGFRNGVYRGFRPKNPC